MKAKIRWTLEFEYPLYGFEDSDLEFIQFYLEESHCQENLLTYLVDESEPGICKLCSIGNVELLEVIKDDNG
jgi:hypothetical protein